MHVFEGRENKKVKKHIMVAFSLRMWYKIPHDIRVNYIPGIFLIFRWVQLQSEMINFIRSFFLIKEQSLKIIYTTFNL